MFPSGPWAIDTGSFRKLSIYLLLPAGSWFVAPILRKMMDTVFVESVVPSLINAFR